MKLHIHIHSTPITSRYRGFGSRDIMFQCRCGHKISKKESREFGEPFSFDGICLNNKSFYILLDSNNKVEHPINSMMDYYKSIGEV